MKCEHCGYNLQIEDRYCPYCGQPNPFARQHQKEMDRFSKQFEETRDDVLEQASRFNRRTVRITILAVLTALCAVMAFLCVRADDIRWMREERAVERNADTHRAVIEEKMREKDFSGLYHYMSDNRLSYADVLREYDAVYMTSYYYRYFLEDLSMLTARRNGSAQYTYYTESGLLEELSRMLSGLYSYVNEEPSSWNEEQYTPEKTAYMQAVCDEVAVLSVRYLNLTPEEASGMQTLSSARLTILLEEAYER